MTEKSLVDVKTIRGRNMYDFVNNILKEFGITEEHGWVVSKVNGNPVTPQIWLERSIKQDKNQAVKDAISGKVSTPKVVKPKATTVKTESVEVKDGE